MFIYNLKVNGGLALKIIIILLSIFMLIVFGVSIYRIFFTSGKFVVKDKIEAKEITEIKPENYINILQAVHENPSSYIGIKIRFVGYLYRVLDFEENQFVLARDMFVNDQKSQTVVVGFLCEYKNATEFIDGEWVELTGIIENGKYHNQEIPIIKVTEMKKTVVPESPYVNAQNNTYITTNGIL